VLLVSVPPTDTIPALVNGEEVVAALSSMGVSQLKHTTAFSVNCTYASGHLEKIPTSQLKPRFQDTIDDECIICGERVSEANVTCSSTCKSKKAACLRCFVSWKLLKTTVVCVCGKFFKEHDRHGCKSCSHPLLVAIQQLEGGVYNQNGWNSPSGVKVHTQNAKFHGSSKSHILNWARYEVLSDSTENEDQIEKYIFLFSC
jgi:hypothetical protein